MQDKKYRKHGMSHTPIYWSWRCMKQRCSNPNDDNYHIYGKKGITICEEWNFFINFFNDMGERPKDKTLDRIDNSKGYYKENCRWATPKEQANNRGDNHLITYKNKTQNISQWAEEFGIDYHLLRNRLVQYGWTVEEALTIKPSRTKTRFNNLKNQ